MLPMAIVALIASHGIILRYISSHTTLSTAVVSGVIVLVAIKHVGLLGSILALLRRPIRRNSW